MTMQELMKTLKPVKSRSFLKLCSAFRTDIQTARESGETHYEIRSRYTKSGNPVVIEFYENQ